MNISSCLSMTYLNANLYISASFPFHSVCSPGSHLLLLRCTSHSPWTSPIQSVRSFSFALVLHFCNHSDSLTQHQPCHTTALIFPSPVARIYFFIDFFFFTLPSLEFLSLLFSLFYHLRVQLPAPCFGSLSILT